MDLVRPAAAHLPDYAAALNQGWSPDNLRPQAAEEQLAALNCDPTAFLARFEDRDAAGDPITLADGSQVPRLPSFRRWIWQDGFCGTIGLRWQPGTDALPPHCLGHIGYAIVPWRRREGLASAALIALLPEARALGLNHVDLVTEPTNMASVRVIEKSGGTLVEAFREEVELGGARALRYRILLTPT